MSLMRASLCETGERLPVISRYGLRLNIRGCVYTSDSIIASAVKQKRERTMRFTQGPIEGVWLIEPVPHADSRGSFARTFCVEEFREHGLATNFSQHSISHSTMKHTLRGLHFQAPPFEEEKLVSCIQGAVWDVAVDLRPQSPTYLEWMAVLLSPENRQQIYIPKGCAHGFQSLKADSVVAYLISTPYHAESARGLRYDDPALQITWPAPPTAMSEKDQNWPAIVPVRTVRPYARSERGQAAAEAHSSLQ